MRAEVSKDLFGIECWPPLSLDEIKRHVELGTTKDVRSGLTLFRGGVEIVGGKK